MIVARPSLIRPAVFDLRPILVAIGILLIILARFMAPPMVADMAAGHPDWQVFLAAGAVTLFTGVTLVLMNQGYGEAELTSRHAFLMVTAVWLVVALFAFFYPFLAGIPIPQEWYYFEIGRGVRPWTWFPTWT